MTRADTSQPSRSVSELRRDQRGAIMVIGTFMAFFLTAGMFYILGTGEAILYRERVQDAADAIAFSSAGIHARGMNMIVLINMIMAAILAVLVALKMLVALLTLAGAIACPLSLIPFAAPIALPVCNFTVAWTPRINSWANTYQNSVVKPTLPALSFAQKVIAKAAPYWGFVQATSNVAPQYQPLVTSGYALSPSMAWYDGKLGLPVEEDDFEVLCGKAGEYVGEIAFGWIPDPIGGGLRRFAGFVAESFPGYFCGGGGMSLDGFNLDLKDLAADACERQEQGEREEHANANGGDTSGFEFDMDQCKEDREQEMQQEIDEQTSEGFAAGAQGSLNTGNMTSKKLYGGAPIGDFEFMVFGLANADAEWPRRTDKGILIATSGGSVSAPAGIFNSLRFAQAEFYLHKQGNAGDEEYIADAMWTLGWRARLRRIRPMAPELGSRVAGGVMGKLQDLIGGQITDWLMDSDQLDFILGKSTFDWASDWAKDQVEAMGVGVDKWLDKQVLLTSWEIIH